MDWADEQAERLFDVLDDEYYGSLHIRYMPGVTKQHPRERLLFHIAAALRAERERCARICDAEAIDEVGKWRGPEEYRLGAKECARRIRKT